MPGGRRPIVSTESLILLSNSDDSKFCSFSMKPLARRVTTLSRRRFGSMFLPVGCDFLLAYDLDRFWTWTATPPTRRSRPPVWLGQAIFGKKWKNGKRCDHHPVNLQFIHFVQEERSGCQAVAVSAVAVLLSATHFA